ncbi:hypothetical protein GK047_21615 [Paenibacillus sp. SYP-B3998]|uniref:Uncharacterized protein n=1 Tax=Paenibacillus sp. SYP-B3998 TaxID=2678564 RepID=A0A6G4A2T3_9BACL|nr:hypothetical protein [Paenibacillus sp. SYP-B3998]NEW08598.1 hypothetical protein [Paenibacillus sp. SYP-B3998]
MMKMKDWMIALIFIVMGLCCLSLSAINWLRTSSIGSYTVVLLKLCVIGTVPLAIGGGLVYYISKRR